MSASQRRTSAPSSAANQNNTGSASQSNRSAKSATTKPAEKPKNSYMAKEEEYMRLNAEIEQKTAALVSEADEVLKANERMLSEASNLTRNYSSDYINKLVSVHVDDKETKPPTSAGVTIKQLRQQKRAMVDDSDLKLLSKAIVNAEMDDDSDERNNYNLLDNVEVDDSDLIMKNLIPKTAGDMSSEAQIRFLKAKLRVMQEEIDRLNSDLKAKDEENFKLVQRCKELDEEKQRVARQNASNQGLIDKYKKLSEEHAQKVTNVDVQFQNLKKENEQLKKDVKKQQQDQTQLELRLNRSMEEIEKYKQQLQKTQNSSRDLNEQEKRRVDQLQQDNKRIEKQKNELIQAFKKQLKLIDILKKQKMHLEAAKMLQFTEEEFIKALEWNSSGNTGNMMPPNATN